MRLVTWNCSMALHRKLDAVLRLKPDIAVIAECAAPERLAAHDVLPSGVSQVWIGRNPHKGLAVFAFNGYAVRLLEPYAATLRYIAPVQVTGPTSCNLLAVWAQNASAGFTRKHQAGPFRRALTRYRSFLADAPAIIAGDLNNNPIWDKPGWRRNHVTAVQILAGYGLVSAYHARGGEAHGAETVPTLYWRDRKTDGPTYHIDYVFLPERWLGRIAELSVGSFEDWCGAGMSDHVPIVVDIAI
jgi:exodeoxyribonuclease III